MLPDNDQEPTTEVQNSPFLRALALLLLMIFVGSGGWLFWLATRHAPAPVPAVVAP